MTGKWRRNYIFLSLRFLNSIKCKSCRSYYQTPPNKFSDKCLILSIKSTWEVCVGSMLTSMTFNLNITPSLPTLLTKKSRMMFSLRSSLPQFCCFRTENWKFFIVKSTRCTKQTFLSISEFFPAELNRSSITTLTSRPICLFHLPNHKLDHLPLSLSRPKNSFLNELHWK